MKIIHFNFLLISFFSIIGCHKDKVIPSSDKTGMCRISKSNTKFYDDITLGYAFNSSLFEYDVIGNLRGIIYDTDMGLYYVYDGQGRLIKLMDARGGIANATNFWYKYDISGRLIEKFSASSFQTYDSSVYASINPTMVEEIYYDYLSSDTLIKNHEADANGNIGKTYSNMEKKDSMILFQGYEYYEELIPSSFKFHPEPAIFQNKNLLKKVTFYNYHLSGSEWVSNPRFISYSYTFDAEGKVTQYIIDPGPGLITEEVDLIYDCY